MKPKLVNVRAEDGSITRISLAELKQHEELIILDNMFFGLKHPEASTQADTEAYEKEARKELKELLAIISENPDAVLELDRMTQRYVVRENPQ